MQISAVSLQYVQSGQVQAQPAETPPPPPELPEREGDSVELGRQRGPGEGPGRRVGPRLTQDAPWLKGTRHDNGRHVGPPTFGLPDEETGEGQTVDPAPQPVDPAADPVPGALGAGDGLTSGGVTANPEPEPVEPADGPDEPNSISDGQTSDGSNTADGSMSMSFGESFGNAEFNLSFDGQVTGEALSWFRQGMAEEVGRFVDAAGMSDAQRQDFVQAYWDFAHDLRGLIEAKDTSSGDLADKFHEMFGSFTSRVSDVLAGGVVDVNPIDTGATGLVLDTSA